MQRTKIGKCPYCCPDGGACFEATYGVPEVVVQTNYGPEREPKDSKLEDYVPVWKCHNCGMEIERRTPQRKDGWTPSQKKAFDYIRGYWRRYHEHVDPTGFVVTSKQHCTEFHATRSAIGSAIVTVQWTEFLTNRHGKHMLERRGVFRVGRNGAIRGTKRENGKEKAYRGSNALIHTTW